MLGKVKTGKVTSDRNEKNQLFMKSHSPASK